MKFKSSLYTWAHCDLNARAVQTAVFCPVTLVSTSNK